MIYYMSGEIFKKMMNQEIHGFQNKDLIESKNFKESYYQKINSQLPEKLGELKSEHFNIKQIVHQENRVS